MNCNITIEHPDISIIVCTYNCKEMLSKALDCMVFQETHGMFSFEIIVVDDGSTDGTKDIVDNNAEKARVAIRYFRTKGKGISHARNIGVAKSHAKWIAFFDQDQLTDSNWLMKLLDVATKNGAYVVDGPRDLVLPKEQLLQLSAVCRMTLGERRGKNKPHKWIGRTCSCTGNVLINSKVFDVVDGFDETITKGGEDWDFFRKVKSAGFEIWYAPKALVHHMIPLERLKDSFFKKSAIRTGIYFPYRDYKEWGLRITVLAMIARIMQAILINLPLLFWASLIGNHSEVLGRKCLLLRAIGYTRRTLSLLFPRIFFQKHYFDQFELREKKD